MLPLYGQVVNSTADNNVTNEDVQSSHDVTYIGVITDEYGNSLYGFPVQ